MTEIMELHALKEQGFDVSEPGVAELIELYSRAETIYIEASASITEAEVIHTLDSSIAVSGYAYLGRDTD